MRIVGFPVDAICSQDDRVLRSLGTRQAVIQATLDLIQAGDVEPAAAAIAIIAGVPSSNLFRHFTSLADLYAAAFDLAVSRAFDGSRPVDARVPLANRIELLLSDRAQVFERWLPVWNFAVRAQRVAPAVGSGVVRLRKLLRQRLAMWFSTELGTLDGGSREAVLDSLDLAFGFDSWMNLREQLRLSPIRASRTWRFNAEAVVLHALTVPNRSAPVT